MAHVSTQLAIRSGLSPRAKWDDILNVILVCPYDVAYRGGVQAHVRGLATALSNSGHDVCIMAPGAYADPLDESVAFISLGSSFRFPTNGSMAPLGIDPRMLFRMELELDKADVVHVHEPMLPACIAALLRTPKQTRRVATFHASRGSSVLLKIAGKAASGILRRIDSNLAVSNAAAQTAHKIAGVDCQLVANGVDVASFLTAAPDEQVQALPNTILFVGRNETRKGLDYLLQAFQELDRPDANLVVVPGSRAISRDSELIYSLGEISDQRKQSVYAAAHVACFPATGAESFGIVLIEALAAGCHVVASDLPGFREAGGDVVNWVQPRDVSGLKLGIAKALQTDRTNDQQLRIDQAMKFDWSAIAAQTISHYAKTVS